MVVELINRFKDGIIIHVIDPQSLPGIFKSLRYRVKKYPTFIIDGQELVVGWDQTMLNRILEARSSNQEALSINA
jgi:hypothetical protein